MKAYIFITVILAISSVYGQSTRSDYTSSLTRSAAERIQRTYGVTVDHTSATLGQLSDLESRLSTCARIERTHGLRFNYRTSSLSALLDVESRLSAASRLKRTYGLDCDYRSYSVSQLLDFESRIGAAQRVNRTYSKNLDWRTLSLSQILDQERQFIASTQPQVARRVSGAYTAAPTISQRSSGTTSSGYYSRYYDYTYRPSVGDHYVSSHIRSDGTYVQGHMKTNSDDSFWNNWSSSGNTNPYTGRTGTKQPPYSYRSYSTPSYRSYKTPSYGGSSYVGGYFKSNGTYVSPHYRKSR